MPDEPLSEKFDEPIPDAYLIAIGKGCVAWGRLESVVDLAISKLSGLGTWDPRGAIITTHMAWPLKMDVLEALVTALVADYPHLSKFVGAIKPLLRKAQVGRNLVVHGQWVEQKGKVFRLSMTARGELKTNTRSIALAEIHSVAVDISRAGAAVLNGIIVE